jgi:hypothetical protein
VYNSSPNTVTSLLGGAGGNHAFVMSATRFWHRITVECDLPSILPVALSPVASVGIFNALTTSALGVRKFANCVPVGWLNRFSQWRLWYSGSQKSEVCPMPYALCPMPSRTSSFARKAICLDYVSLFLRKIVDLSSHKIDTETGFLTACVRTVYRCTLSDSIYLYHLQTLKQIHPIAFLIACYI